MITLVYANEYRAVDIDTQMNVFLAGPSPRLALPAPNWRLDALGELEDQEFEGTAYIPLPRGKDGFDETDAEQMEWELDHLEKAAAVMFWIPRDLERLPGFTTNVEFGMYARSGKAVLGVPDGAPKTAYLRYVAKRYGVRVHDTLRDTVAATLELLERRRKITENH